MQNDVILLAVASGDGYLKKCSYFGRNKFVWKTQGK